MTYSKHGIIALAFVILAFGGRSTVGQTDGKQTDQNTNKEEPTPLVHGINSFALDLFGTLKAEENPSKNLFVSPLSIHTALTMSYAGASGRTQKKMATVLRIQNIKRKDMHLLYKRLMKGLESGKSGITLNMANTLRIKKGLSFSNSYLSDMKTYYSAVPSPLTGNPVKDAEEINRWVKKKTENMIEKLVSPSMLRKAVFVLLNAIYFKGDWTFPFKKTRTKEGTFHLSDGSKKSIDMMHTGQKLYYTDLKKINARAVRLPYGDSQRFGMILFLPDQDKNTENVISNLTNASRKTWKSRMSQLFNKRDNVDLALPRFKVNYGTKKLNPILKQMGFPLSNNNFKKMGVGSIPNLLVAHRAVARVHEKGTEASAATAVVGKRGVRRKINFHVNRPFFFLIRDKATGLILFMGSVHNPQRLK